ncbi:MAG: right-handed parallel beta-helix repeat-containing protein [candidate division Zixibacteria bacterium]
MRKLLTILLLAIIIIGCEKNSHTIVKADKSLSQYSAGDSTGTDHSALQNAINSCENNDTLWLEAGIYFSVPQEFIESLCGNCSEHQTEVNASTGFVIKDKAVTIIGRGKDSTILISGAGYGVYFENSGRSSLLNLKVTGGKRDVDGAATDAAVVVRNSKVDITNCALSDNDHRIDSVVVGIGGVFGREGAEIFISNSEIINNGWDGMALYRGASAVIKDCIIKKGRGAGIGVTWDAHCLAIRNQISEFWKGIGSFGTSTVMAHNNLVYDNLGWGIIGTGESYMDATNNVVYHNGNCGVAPWSQECRGKFVNNIIERLARRMGLSVRRSLELW